MKRLLGILPLAAMLAFVPAITQATPQLAERTLMTAAFPTESYQAGYHIGISDAQYFADAYANGSISYQSYLYNVEATRARVEQLRDEAAVGSDEWAYFNGYLDGFR
ncbi:hypothetical protein [Hymenobacter pini]|uniref:hypothetical protein n=1 Tax=Hymenobacter pini TaxID=2880879 RepID=UPI001CF27095|nr:hypothetical protein [Hymenobacter pini]MCA8830323.1 hypothetical protein [Hymenobacter pini]